MSLLLALASGAAPELLGGGSFSCVGNEATIRIGRRITADTQAYTEDLKPANLYKSITAPTDIAQGIKGWFDASNSSSLTVSSNNLTVWNDLSGQNDHLDTIQGNNPKSGLRTISGKNAIEFNNDGAIYDFDNTGGTTAPNATIAMVFVADATDGTIVSSRTTLDTKIRLDSSSKLVMYGGSANQAASTRNITTSQIYTAIGIFTGTTSKLWINGVSEDMSISSEDRLFIAMIGAGGAGDTDYFDGLVGEVAIYENALSDSEALSLHSYLYKKWVLDKTILSDTSSYSFNGGDANLLVGRKLVSNTGAFRLETNILTPVFSDDFNRANATTLGANWNTTQGSFAISSNKVYGNITDYNSFATPTATFNSDQAAKITISGDFSDAADHVGVGVRLSAGVAADYRTWTELDPTSVLSKVSDAVTITSMNAVSGTGVHGVWYDGGTNWKTGDFWSSVGAVTITATSSDNSRFIVAALTDNNTSGANSGDENRPSIQVRWIKTATSQRLELAQFRSTDTSSTSPAVSDFYEGSAVALNTPFYIEFERVGSTANCRIYSNASHTTLVDTLTISLTEVVSMRYYYVAGKSSTGSSATVSATIGPVNLDVPQTGYVFRTDGFPAGNRTLLRLSYGNFVTIGAPTLPIIGGETIELKAVGSVLSLYINDILKYTTTDTLYTSGKPGILYIWSNTRDVFLDDFYGWNILPSVDLNVNRTLEATTQTYTEDLRSATILVGRNLVADTRSYSLVGNDVTLTKSGGAKIITADTQSYSISGSANLIVSRKLLADVQTYNEDLKPANVLAGRKLLAAQQTYTEDLKPANLSVSRKLLAAVQTYNENLQPANLLIGRKLLAAAQSYNEDLKPANLIVARKLLAAVQTYNENLQPANLTATRKLLAAVQSYNENLQPANLLAGKKLFADVQTYNENLQPANLFVGRPLTADVRSYALDGKPATFPLTRKLISEKSTYTLIGNSLSFSTLGKITADVRSYSLVGYPIGLRVTRRLVSDTQSYTFLGKDANIKIGRKISANISAYILSGNDAGVLRGRKLTADFSSYALSGKTANFPLGRRLIANNTNYSLDGKNVNVLYGRKVQLTKYTSTLTGNTANLLAGRKLLSAQTSYNLNTIPASLKYGRKLPISVANYNFTFNQLLFSRGGFIKVWTGTVWASKPLKVWNGTAWVSKPLKVWNGTTWRTF